MRLFSSKCMLENRLHDFYFLSNNQLDINTHPRFNTYEWSGMCDLTGDADFSLSYNSRLSLGRKRIDAINNLYVENFSKLRKGINLSSHEVDVKNVLDKSLSDLICNTHIFSNALEEETNWIRLVFILMKKMSVFNLCHNDANMYYLRYQANPIFSLENFFDENSFASKKQSINGTYSDLFISDLKNERTDRFKLSYVGETSFPYRFLFDMHPSIEII